MAKSKEIVEVNDYTVTSGAAETPTTEAPATSTAARVSGACPAAARKGMRKSAKLACINGAKSKANS